MCHILTTFEKRSPSGFHATIHLLKPADERSTAVVAEYLDVNKHCNHDNSSIHCR